MDRPHSGSTRIPKLRFGQTAANYELGRLTQDQSMAWSEYLDNPTEGNRRNAETDWPRWSDSGRIDAGFHDRAAGEAAFKGDARYLYAPCGLRAVDEGGS